MESWPEAASTEEVKAVGPPPRRNAYMKFSRRFYTSTAICSFLSAGTTLLLIFLPRLYDQGEGLEGRLELVGTVPYIVRAWTYLLHPFVVSAAAVGIATVLVRRSAGATVAGLLGFLLWGVTEAGQQALTLVWYRGLALGYLSAGASDRASIAREIATYDAVWDSMFLLLLLGFLLGNVAFGWAFFRGRGLGRLLGGLFLLIAFLTVFNITGHLGGPALPSALGPWVYPVVQPITRVLVGFWLLDQGRELLASCGAASADS